MLEPLWEPETIVEWFVGYKNGESWSMENGERGRAGAELGALDSGAVFSIPARYNLTANTKVVQDA